MRTSHRCFLTALLLNLSGAIACATEIQLANVLNAGNPADENGLGAVGYDFAIGVYEVTNAQYAAFLNSVDPSGSNELRLYNIQMNANEFLGGIDYRPNAEIGTKYSSVDGRENWPVIYVAWWDAARFANWLHNGGGSGNTEDGAYTMGALTSGGEPVAGGGGIRRNDYAIWFLPSSDEWYKAAFHTNSGTTGDYFSEHYRSEDRVVAEAPPGGMSSGNFSQVVKGLTSVGSYGESYSAYGVFDLAGNVEEWLDTHQSGSARATSSIGWRGSASGSSGAIKGANASIENDDIGFRIARRLSLPEGSEVAWEAIEEGQLDYDEPGNWSPAFVPNSKVDAVFSLSAIVRIAIDDLSQARNIRLNDGTVHFVGDGEGTLAISGSMQVSNADAFSLQDAAGVAFGDGASLTVADAVMVGRDGIGSLETQDASVTVSAGRLVVGDGPGAIGSVRLQSGASFTAVGAADQPQVVVGANGGQGEIWIEGGEFEVATESGKVLIGQGAGSVGRMSSSEGATLRLRTVEIAVGAGAQGFLEADGDLIQASDLKLGIGGLGTISLTRGAWLSQTGAGWSSEPAGIPGDAYLALVDDAGTPGEAVVEVFSGAWDLGRGVWGVDGSASIDVSGGNVNASSDVSLGVNPGSFGKATLLSLSESHGAVQTLDVGGDLVVGAAGKGLLQLLVPHEGESRVNVGGKLVIGEQAGTGDESVVTLDGVGSLLTAPDIEVGRGGRGWLQVGDLGELGAGTVTATQVALGITPTGRGKLSVAGGASVLETDGLIVGSLGKGVVEIVAAGQIRATQRVFLGADSASLEANELLVSGSDSLLQANRIHIGHAGRGQLLANDGGAVEAANFVAAHDAGSRGEVVVDGAGARITARDLGISTLGEATLAITNGAMVEASRRFWAGYADDGTASVVVDGVGSLLDIGAGPDPQRGLLIGGEPTATGGQGTLTVSNGARLNAREEVLVGPNVTADGTLIVTGSGSLADFTNAGATDDLTSVGAAGMGRLHVLDGGVVLSQLGVVGAGPAAVGNVHVSGNGSAWQSSLMAIGAQGTAQLAIEQGGRVATVLDAYLARQAGSNAQVTVGGEAQAHSVLQVGDGLYVGGDQGSSGGTANVDVLPNGRVEVAQNLTVRPQGRVEVKGGSLTVDGEVALKGELELLSGALSIGEIRAAQQVDFQDLFAWNAGTLTLTSQGLRIDAEGPLGATVNLVPGKTLVTEGGGLDNQGLLNVVSTSAAFRGGPSVNAPTGTINVTEGTLEFAGGLVNEGTLSLFDANVLGSVANALGGEATLSGSNSVSGAYAMGPLNGMSVRVRSQSSASRLEVGGVATLGGAVNVTLIGGYVPALGQRVAFVEAGELVGEFATENLPAQREGVAFYVNYTDTTASLLATYPTDFSADGEVGDADFARWEAGFGPRAAIYKAGDANEDGAADAFDLLAWQRQYGLAIPAATAAVPEAHALLTVAMALLALVAKRPVFGKALTQ